MLMVAVRRDDGGKGSVFAGGAVEIAAEVKAGIGFEQNLFDGVAVALELSKNLRVERRLFRQRQQTGGEQDLVAKRFGSLEPRIPAADRGPVVVGVEVPDFGVAAVVGG
jgi:hypothetical protein